MCRGGRFLASFRAGTRRRPAVPDPVRACLTETTEGLWVVWAHKLARPVPGGFQPLTGGDIYPADATAHCRFRYGHAAPDKACTCGFHAVSAEVADAGLGIGIGFAHLDVVLSGRILVFDWPAGGVLFRAERQTVARVGEIQTFVAAEHFGGLAGVSPRLAAALARSFPPDDPDGRLARPCRDDPRDTGPVRLDLPREAPAQVDVADDAGYCFLRSDATRSERRPAPVPAYQLG